MLISILMVVLVSHLNLLVKCYEIPEKVNYDLDQSESLFKSFISKHNKEYTDEQYNYRFEVFQKNLKKINELNKEHEETVFGLTSFSDLTPDEFTSAVSCLDANSIKNNVESIEISNNIQNIPEELDYRKQHLVTGVKNQRSCGSCYVFGAIGEIEGQYAKAHKELLTLSEQYPLDCSDTFTCAGGASEDVMKWLAGKPGALLSKDYPDKDYKQNCTANPNKGIVKVKSSKHFSLNDTKGIKNILFDHGPLSISMFAGNDFQHYTGGILNPPECANYPYHNHNIVLVGYGKYKGKDFWLLKNSWGTRWGEKGFFRLATGICMIGSYIASSEVF